MLPSLVRRSSLALVVSFALNGCGGRSLDADVVQWYDPDEEVGGNDPGFSSKGGAFYGTKYTKGGSTFYGTTTYSYGGAEMQPTGGNYYKTTKATTAVGGYRSSSSKLTTASGGYKSSSYKSSYVGGKGGTSSSSARGGSAGASSSTPAAGAYALGGSAGATSLPNAAGASWCAPSTVCSSACQSGYWLAASGCYECACAPPATQLAYSEKTLGVLSCPAASLNLVSAVSTVQSSRWDFVFTWTCSALIAGQPITGTVRASISPSASVPVDATNRTYRLSDNLPTLGIDEAQLSTQATTIGLTPTRAGTWLSLRREANYVHGGIYFVGVPSTGETVTLSGEFILTVPN